MGPVRSYRGGMSFYLPEQDSTCPCVVGVSVH